MPDAAKSDGSGFAAVNIIGLLAVALEITVVVLIRYIPLSVNFCLGFISFVALSFAIFLFGVAREQGKRNIFVALVFSLNNIASIILVFGEIYSRLSLNDPARPGQGHPTFWDGTYFSIITLTTVGYGDITPTLETRSIAAFEALTGYVLVGLLISILVVMAQRMGSGR